VKKGRGKKKKIQRRQARVWCIPEASRGREGVAELGKNFLYSLDKGKNGKHRKGSSRRSIRRNKEQNRHPSMA